MAQRFAFCLPPEFVLPRRSNQPRPFNAITMLCYESDPQIIRATSNDAAAIKLYVQICFAAIVTNFSLSSCAAGLIRLPMIDEAKPH